MFTGKISGGVRTRTGGLLIYKQENFPDPGSAIFPDEPNFSIIMKGKHKSFFLLLIYILWLPLLLICLNPAFRYIF